VRLAEKLQGLLGEIVLPVGAILIANLCIMF